MIAVQKEVNDNLDDYNIILKNNDSSLTISKNKDTITWSLESTNDNYIIFSLENYHIYNILDDLYNNIINCNIESFKNFSYNEFIKFLATIKQMTKQDRNITINDNKNKLKIEKHDYYFKISFLGSNTISMSKDNLSLAFVFFINNFNEFKEINTHDNQISIPEYLFKKLQRKRIR